MRFTDRVAVLTGAGRGIGAATARRIAAEGGVAVISDIDLAPARDVVDEITAAGGRANAVACDVTSKASVDELFDAVVAEHGRLDILVACAGIIRDNLVHRMTEGDWDSVIDTHLKGSFLCAQRAQSHMTEARYGKIVLLSSISAEGNRGQANYSTAKAGLRGMARTLSIELGRFNINVNAVAPGFVETRMTQATAERMGVDFETFKAGASSQIPLGRIGQPEDIASVICFLCSDDSSFMTGQTLTVSGGP